MKQQRPQVLKDGMRDEEAVMVVGGGGTPKPEELHQICKCSGQ